MESEHALNIPLGQENETVQIPPRCSRDSSLDRQPRQSSLERDIQTQISTLASEVKSTVMSLSDTMQSQIDRFNEKLSGMQMKIRIMAWVEIQFSRFHHE